MLSIVVWGVKLKLHLAAVLMLVFALLWGYGDVALMGAIALGWHELCHLMVMLMLGVKPKTVEITPFGGMISQEEE